MRLTQPVASVLLALMLFGCHDDRTEADDDDTGTATLPSDSSGTPDDTTSETGQDPDDTSAVDSSSSTGGDGPGCETQLCGQPAECCDDDEECVLGQCLPACDSAVRCGDDLSTCCAEGDVCLQPSCVTPGDPCLDSYDCPEGQFCEPLAGEMGACLPNQDPVACEIEPDFGDIQLTLEWSFETEHSFTAPMIGDINGDQLPDVIVNSAYVGGTEYAGQIIGLDGRTGNEFLRLGTGSYARTTPAIGNVDDTDVADIVFAGYPMGGNPPSQGGFLNHSIIYAYDGVESEIWAAHDPNSDDHPTYTRQGAVLLTNLDDDEQSEVIFGITVIDNDGLVVADSIDHPHVNIAGGGAFGSNGTYYGGVSTAADLNGDDYPEIISGRDAWSIDWVQPAIGNPDVTVASFWSTPETDGYPAIADLDGDGLPEVVIVSEGFVRVHDGVSGALWCGVDVTGAACSGNDAARTQPIQLRPGMVGGLVGLGGPPTIADFDGDGRVEVGVAGGSAYTLIDFNRDGEDIVQPVGDLPPGPGDAFVRWFAPTQDTTSNATGSSVFDFQGDGIAEVMYQDECYARIFDGATGTVLVEIENPSPTIHEYPIVADVDADGNSEFIVVASDYDDVDDDGVDDPGFYLCAAIPNYTSRHGVFVYGDANDRWVPTRQVWTQHTYHVTNADSNALTPVVEEANWLQAELNNFRQNVQGEGIFNAPDLSIDVAVGLASCLSETFEIKVTVRNEGSLGIPAGVTVSLWEGMDATGMLIEPSQMTQGPLLPGAFEELIWLVPAPGEQEKVFYATVDGAEAGTGSVLECDETNNEGMTLAAACPIPG